MYNICHMSRLITIIVPAQIKSLTFLVCKHTHTQIYRLLQILDQYIVNFSQGEHAKSITNFVSELYPIRLYPPTNIQLYKVDYISRSSTQLHYGFCLVFNTQYSLQFTL